MNKYNIHANYFKHEDHLSSVDFEQTKQYHDVSYFPTLLFLTPAFRKARERGIKVMLDGIGGDDILAADFDHLTDLMMEGKIRQLIAQLRCDAALFSYSPYSLFINYCLKPLIPQTIKVPLKQILKPFRGNGIPSWINTDYLKKFGLESKSSTKVHVKQFPTFAQRHIFHSLFYGWNAIMALESVERFTSHFAMERRYPFLDRHMIEFLISVPEDQRWRGKWPKMVLRQAMIGILPDRVRMRKDKAEFSGVINLEFKKRQFNKVKNILETSKLGDFEIVRSSHLQQLLENYQKRADDGLRNHLENVVWIELWVRSQWPN